MKLLPLVLLLAIPPLASAAIVTSGNFQTGSPTPTLSFTAPITFTITTSTSISLLILDNWVATDNGTSTLYSGATLSYQINGGMPASVPLYYLVDNAGGDFASITADDGYLALLEPVAVLVGQTFTILPQSFSFTFNTDPNFNTPPTTFDGPVFLTDAGGTRISTPGSVPEPSTVLFGALGTLGLLRRRR